MKAVNVTLSILILLLAIASAVFSYFLYEKRTQFIDGWNQLTASIHQNSNNLDQKSGTNVAKGLSKDKLAHTKYASLQTNLSTFNKQSQKVIEQRDGMAETLIEIGKQVDMDIPDASKESYFKIETSKTKTDEVYTKVCDTVKKRNKNYEKLAQIAGANGISINKAGLKDNGDVELGKLEESLKTKRETQAAYKKNLEDIATKVGASHLTLPEDKGAEAAKVYEAVVDKVTKDQNDIKSLNEKIDSISEAKRRVEAERDDVKAERDAAKAAQKNAETAREDALAETTKLRDLIGIAKEEKIPEPWADGSADARAYLRGKVIEVSRDYGYIVIDLGTQSTIIQKIGTKMQYTVNLKLTPGVELRVIRGEKKPELIATVTLDKVGDKISVANIPANAKTIQVGDFVIAK